MPKNNDLFWNSPAKKRKAPKKEPECETLEQFLARGGQIQRVPPGAGKLTLAEIEQEDLDDALSDFCTTVKLK